jgi:hypothetical protein
VDARALEGWLALHYFSDSANGTHRAPPVEGLARPMLAPDSAKKPSRRPIYLHPNRAGIRDYWSQRGFVHRI